MIDVRYVLVAFVLLPACKSGDPSAAAPQPSATAQDPPASVPDAGGRHVLTLDTTRELVDGVIHDAPSGHGLAGHLESKDGKRSLILTRGGNRDPLVVAPSGWNIFAVGAFDADENGLICWNRLTGTEADVDVMPLPSNGLAVFCRRLDRDELGPEIKANVDDAPSWLQDVTLREGGGFDIAYYRDQSGQLYAVAPTPGDGTYLRTDNGREFSEPRLGLAAQLPGD